MKLVERLKYLGMLAALAQVTPAPPIEPIPIAPVPSDIMSLVRRIIGWILLIAGIVAVIYLIYGGYQYLTAGGDPERATKAKTTIINAIIGIIIIALSYAIYTVVIRATSST